MTTEDRPPRDDFRLHWLATIALAVAVTAGLRRLSSGPPELPAPPATVRETSVDWYLVARLPNVTAQYESGIETMRRRYGEWLRALREAGFKPMLLSDVLARLESGEGVPPNTLVCVFEPAPRRTYEIVGPILRAHRWPAVWLTDLGAMRRGHREYITFHDARKMTMSRLWDVGYWKPEGGYGVASRDAREFPLGDEDHAPWSPVDGTFALNRGPRMHGLEALNVASDWTAPELVARLRAEIPAAAGARLTTGLIQHKQWGVTAPESPADAGFELRAPIQRRGHRVYWLGTRGTSDFRLDLAARDLVGTLRLHLRADDAAGRQLMVVFSDRDLRVEEQLSATTRRQLFLFSRKDPGPVKASLTLRGSELAIESGGGRWNVHGVKTPAGEAALLQASVFEKLRGAARAGKIHMTFTPLGAP